MEFHLSFNFLEMEEIRITDWLGAGDNFLVKKEREWWDRKCQCKKWLDEDGDTKQKGATLLQIDHILLQ